MSGDGWITLRRRGGHGATAAFPAALITAIVEVKGESYYETVVTCAGKEYAVEDNAAEVQSLIIAATKESKKWSVSRISL